MAKIIYELQFKMLNLGQAGYTNALCQALPQNAKDAYNNHSCMTFIPINTKVTYALY